MDDRGLPAITSSLVAAYVAAFDAAEAEATRRRRDDFPEPAQQRIVRAQRLLRVASNEAATQKERERAYDLACQELEGLIVLPPAACAAIEQGIKSAIDP